MSTMITSGARCLLLTAAILVRPAPGSAAATAGGADQAQSTGVQTAQEQNPLSQPSRERPIVDAAKTAAEAAATVVPTSVSPPSWLAASHDIDFRLRPNAGVRLRALFVRPTPVSKDDAIGGTTAAWSIRGALATLGVDHDRQSAKFEEYRDARDGTTAGIEAHFRDGRRLMNVVGRHLGLHDQDLSVDGGRTGKLLLSFGYGETPHNYSFNSRSLYDGIGTSVLTMSDRIQADLQASTTAQEAADKIRAYQEQSAQTVELGLLRKKAGVDFTFMRTYPVTIRASASNESREGVRPLMGSFGLGNFEEFPWPVAFDTRDLRFTVEYARPERRLQVSGSYRASLFDDKVPTLRFDNPYRITDTSVGAVGATFANGPTSGLMVMPPSNHYQEVTLSSVFARLPRETVVSGLASFGFLRQNEPLMPFSTNTAAIMPSGLFATDPAALPRATAEAAMDTSLAQVRLTTKPAGRLHLVTQYRVFGLANHETRFTMDGFIREDADVRRPATTGGTYAPVLAAYTRHTVSTEGSVNLTDRTSVALTYTFERMNRDFREVAWMNDHRVKASFDTHAVSRVDVKAWYERSTRNTADYVFNQYNVAQGNPLESPMLPFLRKFDEAARRRDDAQLMATLMITDALSLTGTALYGHDDFFRSPFGLLDDKHRAYSMDLTYSVGERLSFYGSYGVERYASHQKARQWSPTGVSNPYTRETTFDSNSNWEAFPRDNVDTGSVGLQIYCLSQRLRFDVAYTYSMTNGSIAYSSPIGVAADDTNAFDPAPFSGVDHATSHGVNPELEYRLGERLALSAGYHFEKFVIDDVNYRGFTYTPRNLTGGLNAGLLMGSYLFPPFNVSVLYLRLKLGF